MPVTISCTCELLKFYGSSKSNWYRFCSKCLRNGKVRCQLQMLSQGCEAKVPWISEGWENLIPETWANLTLANWPSISSLPCFKLSPWGQGLVLGFCSSNGEHFSYMYVRELVSHNHHFTSPHHPLKASSSVNHLKWAAEGDGLRTAHSLGKRGAC